MMIAMVAIVPAVLFGGFFMAESFTNSETTAQVADATPAPEMDISQVDNISVEINEDGSKHYTVELTESIGMSDSVEVDTP